MRTIVMNQYENFISDKKIITKIEHMMENGYGSIRCGDMMASYDHEEMIDGDRYIFVKVENA